MSIDTSNLAFSKPSHKEGKVTLTIRERRALLDALYSRQDARCAVCGCQMTREADRMNTAVLDHVKPQPMGCKKDDRPENLQALCWKCNGIKGSRRI